MSGIEFFPKVDRSAGLLKPAKADNASSKSSAKKGASAPGDSFADILTPSSSKENQSARSELGRNDKASDRIKDRPSTKNNIRKDEPGVVQAPVRDAATAKPIRTAAQDIRKIDQSAQVQETPPQEPSAMQDKAVVEFMTEMETKFGVAPEQIVEAFSQLDEATLSGRPEDAMNQFLSALQIPPAQIADAQQLYMKMVIETGEALVNEQVSPGNNADVAFSVLSPKEMKLQKLRDSLDEMSTSFFPNKQLPNARLNMFADPMANNVPMMNGQNAEGISVEGMEAPVEGDVEAQTLAASANLEQKPSKNSQASSMFGLGAALGGAAAMAKGATESATQSADASSTASAMSSSLSQNSEASSALGDSSSNQSQDFSGNSSEAQAQQLLQNLEQSLGGLGALAPASFAAASVAAAKSAYGSGNGSGDSRASETDVKIEADASSIGPANVSAPTHGSTAAKLTPEAMLLQMPQATPEENQQNINEVIRNAQVMLKKGGGEMNMQLRPEGLGSVNLKVMVQDGQVSVRMITENDGAKKILENGISDLKQQLAANKLHVDTMKIEAAGDSAMQKFEQSFQEGQRENARQQAHDFMSAFRDDRQGFAQGFMDRPNMSGGYKQKDQKRRDLQPSDAAEVAAASSSKNGRRTDGARRLNLVA